MFNPMKSHPIIAALIVAAGKSQRLGHSVPKPYIRIDGHPILAYSVDKFKSNPRIHKIAVVIADLDREHFAAAIGGDTAIDFVIGGNTRQESVLFGLQHFAEMNPKPDFILIHDAARPNFHGGDIDRIIDHLIHNPETGVTLGQKIADSIHRVNAVQFHQDSMERDGVWAAQTPQSFAFDQIFRAHKKMHQVPYSDDVALAKSCGIPVKFIESSGDNYKITYPSDLERLRSTMQTQMTTKTGFGYDVHPLIDGNNICLGGIKIIHNKTLSGHSDADVVLHAIVDALLGTCAGGDIGVHFPPSDPQWKDKPSSIFVQKAREMVLAKGGQIINVDVCIIAEEPKITPYRAMMQSNIAELLHIPADAVNIKATTSEKMGFVGRGEGIAVHAVANVSYKG